MAGKRSIARSSRARLLLAYSLRTHRVAIIATMCSDRVDIEGAGAGADHMQRDAETLRRCAAGGLGRAIRVYWFAPACLSLGRLEPESDVDLEACARDGIDVVRRPSGGRAVLHSDEVTYAVVCRIDDPDFGGDVMTSCGRIHDAVSRGLRRLGVATMPSVVPAASRRRQRLAAVQADCFARPAAHELLDASGRKLVGSAQARRGRALLQHGSILLSPSRAASYLRPDAPRDAGPSAREPSAGLRSLLGRDISRDEVAGAVAEGFHQIMCAQPLDTTA